MRQFALVQQVWFVACVVGVAVAPIVPTYVAASVLLLGLVLLVYAKDERYAGMSWAAATSMYMRDHRWHLTYRIAGYLGAVLCISLVSDQQTRGIYLACLGAYSAFHLAVPVRAGNAGAQVGS